MREHRTNVQPLPIIVDGGNEACPIPADIEHRQLSDLIRAREDRP